jgi:hypothetical protein
MPVLELLLFVIGPCLLAVWADQRLARHRPTGILPIAAMLGSAAVLCSLVRPLADVVLAVVSGTTALDVYVVLTSAILAYGFLSGLWLVRLGVDAMTSLDR